jgi:hypothetical protein
MIVYNDGYSSANATLFEELTLPGVSTKRAIFKHARFHFAQLKLRPETYTINADMEHLVCTRGDRVKVTHDVPMWGLGTGRIVERPTTTTLVLDEKVPMDAGVQYTIRIRLADGSSVTRTVASKTLDGYYDEITVTFSARMVQDDYGVPGSPTWWTAEDVEIEEVEIGDETFSEKQLPKKLVDSIYDMVDDIEDWDN